MALKLRLYSDFICPFCFIAERSSLARLQREFDLSLDWRGFELHPGTPRGGMPLTRIIPANRVEAAHSQLKRFAAGFGLELTPRTHVPNTRRALAIAELARDGGPARLQAFRDAAMDAYWRDGKDLENDEDLKAIAQSVGLDPAEAIAAADDPGRQARVDAVRAEANELGVSGIPTFFFGDEVVVGCQPYELLAQVAQAAGAERRT